MAKQTSKLNSNALFDSAEKLIAGYNLTANYGKEQNKAAGGTGRKVYLVGRSLKSGNVSLVRYAFNNGKRERESTGQVLRVELDTVIKTDNKRIVREQRMLCDEIEKELQISGSDFAASTRGNVLLSDYLYGDKDLKAYQLDSVSKLLRSLSGHVKVYDDILVRDVTEEWVRGFVEYLKSDAVRLSVKDKQKVQKLSQNTQNKCLVVLSVALNRAVEEKRLRVNPVNFLSHKERIKIKQHTRSFLELSEIKKLMETDCEGDKHGWDIKRGFMFSVLTGLRWSDLKTLRRCDLKEDKNGVYMDIVMHKTREGLNTYVGEQALSLLPETENDSEPLFKLPSNKTANHWLAEWVKAAGITKSVTFHVSRHSCATLLLSNGVGLQNVQAQLGHTRMATTEIYAELLNSARKQTANEMDKIIGGVL